MKLTGNSVLITGGASGIGLALTQRLAVEGNRVLICGRDATKLARARQTLPEIDAFPCDINSESDRQKLLSHVHAHHSDLNVLINNAAITSFVDFTQNDGTLALQIQTELGIDLLAPIQLTALLLPVLSSRAASAIVNITSALAYVPMAIAPLYCAAKAGLHSFSQSLRHQLRNSSTRVVEVLPPAVDTEMARDLEKKLGNGSEAKKISTSHVAERVMDGLRRDLTEIRIGDAKGLYLMSRLAPRRTHHLMNRG